MLSRTTRRLLRQHNGLILYDGPSQTTGERIVLVLTSCKALGYRESKNTKTGAMAQTYTLSWDKTPGESRREDTNISSICGDCPLRNDGCYPELKSLQSVWNAMRAGRYLRLSDVDDNTWLEIANTLRDTKIRWGAYGDPCAVPKEYVRPYATKGDTGYTHLWHWAMAQWAKGIVMASVECPEDRDTAHRLGWRTFRITPAGAPEPKTKIEIPCPSEKGVQCIDCGMCWGDSPAKSITIPSHGPQARNVFEVVS